MSNPPMGGRPPVPPQAYAPDALYEERVATGAAFDDEKRGQSNLRQILGVLSRRKWLVLTVLTTILVIAAIQLYTTTPLYRATTIIQVDPRSSNILPYEEVADNSRFSVFSSLEDVQTQSRKLQTRSLAARVITKLDLLSHETFNKPVRRGFIFDLAFGAVNTVKRLVVKPSAGTGKGPTAEALAGRFLSRIQVQPIRNTRLIALSYNSANPELAAAASQSLAEEFIEQQLESKFEATTRATEFLTNQLHDLQIRVEESEERSLDYARDKKIVNLSDRGTINRKKLADLNDEVTKAQSELIARGSRFHATRDATTDNFPEILSNETVRQLETRLGELERELSGLLTWALPQHPQVNEARLKISKVEQQLEAQKQSAISTAREEYELARQHYEGLASALSVQTEIVNRLNDDSIQYNTLNREVRTNIELYEGLLQRLKEAGVAAGLRSSNIHVVDPPAIPRGVASPKKIRTFALAAFMGLFLGLGAALFAEAFDNTIKSADDVTEQLGLPMLGMVPTLVDDRPGRKGQHGKKDGKRTPLIAYRDAKRFQARGWEAYRSLRTSILLSHSGKPPQTILVTSALPSEGKSTTAANIAIALALTGARTVLVDLDLRRPSLGGLFDVAAAQGMSTFLSGNSDLLPHLQNTHIANLFLLPSGPPAPDPAELIGSDRMQLGLEVLKKEFTFVVIDTPPSLELTDARVLSPHVDGVILVVRSGKTPKEAVRRLGERFHSVGARVLGVLINDLNFKASDYGSYYHYYGDYEDTTSSTGSVKSKKRA